MKNHPFFIFLILSCSLRSVVLAATPPNVVIFLADDAGWGDYSHYGNTQVAHAEHRLDRAGRRVARSLLRLPGLFADARGVSHRALSSARRRARRLDRAGAARPRREDDRRCLQGRGLCDRRVWQMAQRQPVAVSPDGARLRRILRPHLRALGRILRCAAGGERPHDPHAGLHRRCLHGSRARLHRAEQGQAVPLLRAVHHAALAVGRAGGGLAALQGQADHAARDRCRRRKSPTKPAARWR